MTNAACSGYVMYACKRLKYTEQQARDILDAVNCEFGTHTEEEAEALFYRGRAQMSETYHGE